MAEENPPEFKFNADDQDPEAFYREEIKDLRVEKLSQRIILLSILLPILMGVAIFFAYRDLTGRVGRSQDTGSIEVQRISRELEEISKKFNEKLITFSTTLSTQDKNFDATISGKLAEWFEENPAYAKEIVTEIRGTRDGEGVTYRMGTLTCKGALPTGALPAIAAIWLAEGKIEPGVYPPEACLDPEPFFKELEKLEIITRVTVTNKV